MGKKIMNEAFTDLSYLVTVHVRLQDMDHNQS